VQHTMMTFQLHRKGVILLALGALLLGALLYMAGCLVGQRRAAAIGVSRVSRVSRPNGPKLPAAPTPKPASLRAPAVLALPSAPAVSKTPAAPETFALRAGAFTDEAEAKVLVQELAGRGFQASLVPMPTSSGAVLQTVLVGRYASREAAAAAASELAHQTGISAAVVAAKAK
jgi:cell division septation protein DedD